MQILLYKSCYLVCVHAIQNKDGRLFKNWFMWYWCIISAAFRNSYYHYLIWEGSLLSLKSHRTLDHVSNWHESVQNGHVKYGGVPTQHEV
jgi:hypothetical protein